MMLRLTRRSEYGLMAMAYLAGQTPSFTSVREIGDHLAIPRRLLAEVLKDLARGGIVKAWRNRRTHSSSRISNRDSKCSCGFFKMRCSS